MCGIWAVFGTDEDMCVQCNAAHKITHRGPDAFRIESIHLVPSCCLGFHRLAIVDDLAGMQPMRIYKYPHIWLLYNGEIYNHKLLRKEFDFPHDTECDGEVIIHLYHHGGIEFAAKHLDGVFAFVLLDTANRKVFLGRDTFGVRPMFRFKTDNGFLAVCSEGKDAHLVGHPEIFSQHLRLFLSKRLENTTKMICTGDVQRLFGTSHANVGILGLTNGNSKTKVEPFLPGHVESYSLDIQGRVTLDDRTRFNKIGEPPAYKTVANPIDNDQKESIRVLFEAAVQKRLMSDRRIGCLLSGGLDSSLVASILVKLAKKKGITYPIQTFSIGMEGSPDIIAAKKVAQHLGTEHHEIVFTPEEGIEALQDVIYHLESYDITTIRASVGMYLLSKYIKEKTDTTVILSGEGSDEIAQGYIYFHKAPSAEDGDEESKRLCKDLYMYDVLRGDRTTAAWGLEIRVPFLDHRFSSYYLSLPVKDKVPRDGVEKYLIRSAFDSSGLLPEEILWRPKEAFSDGVSSASRSWYEVLQEFIDEQINDTEVEKAPSEFSFNPPKTKEALYYRRIFEKLFSGQSHWIPYYWMPKWSKTTDPSARTLKHYKQ